VLVTRARKLATLFVVAVGVALVVPAPAYAASAADEAQKSADDAVTYVQAQGDSIRNWLWCAIGDVNYC
jgi:ethanolamine utilization microcompartment shell protein EutL